MADRDSALRVLMALRDSPVGNEAVLVVSSGLFGFPTEVPALTEAFSDAGAEGYVPVARQVEIGLKRLLAILERMNG